MVDKSNEYGYIPSSPTQTHGSNNGIFQSNDVVDLINLNQWSRPGQLELIETQTVSGTPTNIDFTTIKEDIYDVHFMTYNNLQGQSTTAQDVSARLSNDGGSTFESANYQHANQNFSTAGVFSENKSTNFSRIMICPDLDNETNASTNGYIYFYNLGDSAKYTFVTDWNFVFQSAVGGRGRGGSAVYPFAETMNGIRLFAHSGGGFSAGTVSLYGIRSY